MINETDYTNNKPLTNEQENQIDLLFKKYDTKDKPGCSVGVIRDGKFIYKKSYGLANLDYDIPITADSKFDIGSMTKQFTAVCIALLQIESKLNFDDDVRKFIPELPDYGKKITIRHLILHTSGLRDYACFVEMCGIDLDVGHCYYNNKDFIKIICKIKELNFNPGEEFQYCNTGYLILAEIISKVTGKSYSKFVKERIFDPLGMDNSLINDNWRQVIKNRVVSYSEKETGGYDTYIQISEDVGDGGLVTTVNDLLLWDQNFYSGKVGGEELKEVISSLKTYCDVREEQVYGSGLISYNYNNIPVISHSGSVRGFVSDMRRFPDYKTSIIILFNNPNSVISLTDSVSNIIFADIIQKSDNILKSKEVDFKPLNSDLNIFCGLYHVKQYGDNPKHNWYIQLGGYGLISKIHIKDGDLFYWKNDGSESRLIRKSENEFIIEGGAKEITLIFDITSNKKVMKLLNNGKCRSLSKSYESEICPSEKLSEYAGKFHNSEMDVEYHLKVEKDKLSLYLNDKKETDVKLHKDNIFILKEWFGSLQFCFDDKNVITGILVNDCRVQKMRLEKILK